MKSLRSASIRKQLLFLAILLVILVSMVAATTEPFIYGRHDKGIEIGLFAGRVEMVLDQFAHTRSAAEEADVLSLAGRMGIVVRRTLPSHASVSYDADTPTNDVVTHVKAIINDGFLKAVRNAIVGDGDQPELVVKVPPDRALAFVMPHFPTSVWLLPAVASGILKILLPLILLAYVGSWLVTEPLVRFALAAQRASMDDHSEEAFKAEGSSELRSLAASLNVMQSRIQLMLRERTRILRAISHDLRTPLTRLRMRIERSNEPELKDLMLSDVAALSSLIDASLSFLDNKFEAPRKVDLSSLLQTIANDFADTGVDIKFLGPRRLAFICMPQGLTRAVSNLVDNASRYAQKIELELVDRRDRGVLIKVSDDGPGLSDDLKSKVLQPFFKADEARQTSGEVDGFGLGLSIAQGIVTIGHKGSMALLDRKPHGLRVDIVLPEIRS